MKGTFRLQEGYTCRMPVSLRNYPFNKDVRVYYEDCRCICADQKTDFEALAPLIPEEYEILAPVINWQYANCRGVDFMTQGEYRILQASVPVRFCGKEDTAEGIYPLVILEDNAMPVLGGREEDGMPKLVCDISLDRHMGDHWFAAAASDCETIVRLNFHEGAEWSREQVDAFNAHNVVAAFGNRCLPNVDRPGNAYQDHILYPQQCIVKRAYAGTGDFTAVPPAEWYVQPQFAGILYALAGLPNHGFENAAHIECALRLCVSDSRQLK